MNGPAIVIDQEFLAGHADLYQQLLASVEWDESMSARKTASFGNPYDYSQMSYDTVEFLPALNPVADRLEERLGFRPNNCLLNLYEDGNNTMGFHSDETDNLEANTGVAIISLGSARNITFRSKVNLDNRHAFTLEPGSLLYMDQAVQDDWMHAIRKQAGAGSRISLTWRAIRGAA